MSIGFNILDIVILVIVGLTCYFSYKRGLLLTVYNIVSFFLAIGIAWMLNPLVNTCIVNNTNWENNISISISNTLATKLADDIDAKTMDEKKAFIDELNVPSFLKKSLVEKLSDPEQNSVFVDFIVENLTNICIAVISFLIVIVIVMIILSFVKIIINWISTLPIIDGVNKWAGAIFGVLSASIKIWIVFMIVGLFINMSTDSTIIDYINDSFLGRIYYNNNFVCYLVMRLLA